jgi:hypothetical protein
MADPGRKYTVKYILSLLGISRASYYAILKNGTMVKRSSNEMKRMRKMPSLFEGDGIQRLRQGIKTDLYDAAPSHGAALGTKKDTPHHEGIWDYIIHSEIGFLKSYGWSSTPKKCKTKSSWT